MHDSFPFILFYLVALLEQDGSHIIFRFNSFEKFSTIFPKIQKLTEKRHSQFSITLYPFFFCFFFHGGKTIQETFWLHARGVSFTCERDVFLWKEPVLSRKRTMTARTISPRGTILLKQWLWFYFFKYACLPAFPSLLLSSGFFRQDLAARSSWTVLMYGFIRLLIYLLSFFLSHARSLQLSARSHLVASLFFFPNSFSISSCNSRKITRW